MTHPIGFQPPTWISTLGMNHKIPPSTKDSSSQDFWTSKTGKAPQVSFWSRHGKRITIWAIFAVALVVINGLMHTHDSKARNSLLYSTLKSMPSADDQVVQVNSDLLKFLGKQKILEATRAADITVSNVVMWNQTTQTRFRIANLLETKATLFTEALEAEYDHERVLYTKRWTCVYVFGFWLRLFPRTETDEADNLGASSDLEPADGVQEVRVPSREENGWKVWDLPETVQLRLHPDTRSSAQEREYGEVEIRQKGKTIWNAALDTTIWTCPMQAKAPWTRKLKGGAIQIILETKGYPGTKAKPYPRLTQILVQDGQVRLQRWGAITSVGDQDGDGHEEVCYSTAFDREDCLGKLWYQPFPCLGNTSQGYVIDTSATRKFSTLNTPGWHGFDALCTEDEARQKSL